MFIFYRIACVYKEIHARVFFAANELLHIVLLFIVAKNWKIFMNKNVETVPLVIECKMLLLHNEIIIVMIRNKL